MIQERKKILIHLHHPPIPVDGGASRRVLGFLKYFGERQNLFQIDAVSDNPFGVNRWTDEHQKAVLEFVDNLFLYKGEGNLLDFLYSRSQSFYYQKLRRQQLPIDSDYYTPPGYVKYIQNLISTKSYDFIWINLLCYAHLAVRVNKSIPQKIIDIHDIFCETRLAKKEKFNEGLKFDYESNFIKEVNLLNKFDKIIVNSSKEVTVLNSDISSAKLCLIPHLVEDDISPSSIPLYRDRKFKYDLLFVGTIGHRPNLEGIKFFIDCIFPKIIQAKPNVKLAIAGTVSDAIEIKASLEDNVECLGYIDNLCELYLQSKLTICPLLSGAGTKVKIQESMSYGIPTVTTSVGASGMNLIDGVNAKIADQPDIFACAVISLLENPELAQKLSEEILNTFEIYYSNTAVYSQLDKMFGILHC